MWRCKLAPLTIPLQMWCSRIFDSRRAYRQFIDVQTCTFWGVEA